MHQKKPLRELISGRHETEKNGLCLSAGKIMNGIDGGGALLDFVLGFGLTAS
jgi:hypothetical protein